MPSLIPSRFKEALEEKSALLLYLFTSVWLIAWFSYGYGYLEDDAFIHLEFARGLAQGHGFSFNGVVTNGDTSPMWVFLLLGAHHLFNDWIMDAKALMVVSCLAALSALDLVATKLAPKGIAPRLLAAIVVTLLATNPYFVVWFLSGMETLLAVAFGLWIIWAASIAAVNWPDFWLLCLLAGLAPLLRPEFVILDVLVAPCLARRMWSLTSSKSPVARAAVSTFAGVLVAGPLLGWMIYAHQVFGTIIANTSAAKREDAGHSVIKRLADVVGFGFPLIAAFAVGVPVVLLVSRLLSPRTFNRIAAKVRELPLACWITIGWSLGTCAFYIANRTHVQTRYVLVFAAPLTLSIVILIFSLGQKWLCYAVCIGTGLAAIMMSLAVGRPFIANKVEFVSEAQKLAEFIRRLPPQQPVAVFAVGQLAFQSCHPIIDMGGIVNPAVISLVNSPERRLDWARQQGAAYLAGGDEDHPGPGAVVIYRSAAHFAGWTIHPSEFRAKQPILLWSLPAQPGSVTIEVVPPL